MKILFILRSSTHLFYTESIINEMLRKGHRLTVLYERYRGEENDLRLKAIGDRDPNFSYGRAHWRSDKWKAPLYYARALLSYRKYLFMKGQSPYYRDRYRRYMPGVLRFVAGLPAAGGLFNFLLRTSAAKSALLAVENAAGLDRTILEQVREAKPDVLMICIGGLRYGSIDVDYLKVARHLGIPNSALVMTWDSLSSKSLVQVVPDKLFVLNELQEEEAITQHDIPKNVIKITGAAVFDRWFGELKVSLSREEFCRKHGLDPLRPILLYLGSPKSNTGDETWVMEGIKTSLVNSRDERLRGIQIIMRPHPDNTKFYDELKLKDAITLPKGGQWPGTAENLQLFYDCLAHSVAAFGINTSAMIETMLADKPIYTIGFEKYMKTQSLAMHFKKMLLEGGIIKLNDFKELAEELENIYNGRDRGREGRRRFIAKYIRPYGSEVSAASRVVLELEALKNEKR